MCGGTFIGPVGTTREASNMVQSGFPVPPLHVRCAPLLVENAPELLALKESAPSCPVMLRISSRPQAPAWPIPSTQFRKGRRPEEKPFNPMEFSKSRARFRNWVLGQERAAGAWGRDEIRNIVGSIAPWSAENNASGAFSVGDTRTSRPNGTGTLGSGNTLYNFNASLIVSTGPQNVPQHVWQPVILYLGRPK